MNVCTIVFYVLFMTIIRSDFNNIHLVDRDALALVACIDHPTDYILPVTALNENDPSKIIYSTEKKGEVRKKGKKDQPHA